MADNWLMVAWAEIAKMPLMVGFTGLIHAHFRLARIELHQVANRLGLSGSRHTEAKLDAEQRDWNHCNHTSASFLESGLINVCEKV